MPPAAGAGDPTRAGWAEAGAIDQYGHGHGWKIAHHLPPELKGLAETIASAGRRLEAHLRYHRPRPLMPPGGLPKADLPSHLTLTQMAAAPC